MDYCKYCGHLFCEGERKGDIWLNGKWFANICLSEHDGSQEIRKKSLDKIENGGTIKTD